MIKYLFAIIPLLFIMPMASYGEQCEPLDLLCRQTQANQPEQSIINLSETISLSDSVSKTDNSERYATFEKQQEALYNLEKFIERQTISINEYLELITCVDRSCSMDNVNETR